jgi:hypothetical protein
MGTEADTCRKFVVPKLQQAGWDNNPHSMAEEILAKLPRAKQSFLETRETSDAK